MVKEENHAIQAPKAASMPPPPLPQGPKDDSVLPPDSDDANVLTDPPLVDEPLSPNNHVYKSD